MNKYIRTGGNDTCEDVYEVIEEGELYWEIKDKSIPKCIALISKCNIIKESDKLEDLIDLFIINHVAFPKSKVMFNNIIQTRSFINTRSNKPKIKNVFGAIWTEGSKDELILKSVAKINDKGELELL